MKNYTLTDFDADFPDDACLEWIKEHRWPAGIRCRKCQRITKHHRVKNRTCYECDYCGTQIYPMADTIFRKSTTPLRSWFYAVYQIASTRGAISASELQRQLGITYYKTAWRISNRVRARLQLKGKADTRRGPKRLTKSDFNAVLEAAIKPWPPGRNSSKVFHP